jgi:RNA polymerase sigma-54 factor
MGFELNLSQTQKLIMTPELRQAIQILQFNNVELTDFINKQLEINPFLESVDNKSDAASNDDQAVENKENEEIDWIELADKYDDFSYKTYDKYGDDENKQSFESYTSKKLSLKDHLMMQLGMAVKSNKDKRIGEFIIESLDNKGYLGCSLQDISLLINENVVDVERVLRLIQTFDPLGVAARNLSECLMIQLKEKGIQDKNAYIIVERHLEDIATNKIQKIAKDLHISVKRVQNICDIIKMLEPKPSRGFIVDSDNIRYIVPDATIEKN